MSTKAETNLQWAIDRFASDTPGVISTQTVSSDGMHLAASGSVDEVSSDQMAAICSGMVSLADSAADVHGIAPTSRMLVEASNGWIIISRISHRATLAVVAQKTADIGMIGFEMAELAETMGDLLSPELIESLKNGLSVQ